MQLVYNVNEKPPIGKNLVFAFQQIIAIMAATLLVPILVSSAGLQCDPAAALFGAGIGTIVYLLFTRFKSPVFLGSSFTFVGALTAVAAQNYGYWGLIIGVAFAAAVYVVIGIVIKIIGSKWVNKLLPPVIIGPILAIIGLSLSGTAGSWAMANGGSDYNIIAVAVALFTFFMIVVASVKGGKNMKLIPFIIGIGAGLVLAVALTLLGQYVVKEGEWATKMQLVDFSPIINCFKPVRLQSFLDYPKFTFLEAILDKTPRAALDGAAIGNIALLFVPIAVVELAQHISDHKNISNIINKDVLQDPGLHNTLFGDGIGSAVGAFFGGCANTTYGESIGCVALTGNASTWTILFAALGCMVISFFSPFVALINMVPKCVIGGACIALYGFISVSGLNMLHGLDLNDHRNLYPVAAILVIGVGGITLDFGVNKMTNGPAFQLTSLAVAMIVGIIINLFCHSGKDKNVEEAQPAEELQTPAQYTTATNASNGANSAVGAQHTSEKDKLSAPVPYTARANALYNKDRR